MRNTIFPLVTFSVGIIVLLLIAGGLFFFTLADNEEREANVNENLTELRTAVEEDLKKEVAELKKEVEALKEEVAEDLPWFENELSAEYFETDKVTISRTEANEIFARGEDGCIDTNGGVPDGFVWYEGDNLRFKVPYSINWGTNDYAVNPYDVIDDVIAFGSVGNRLEGCGEHLIYPYRVFEESQAEAPDVIAELIADNEASEYPGEFSIGPEVQTFGELEVVTYQKSGLCQSGGYIAIGSDYNYAFVPMCGIGEELLEIVQSAELQ